MNSIRYFNVAVAATIAAFAIVTSHADDKTPSFKIMSFNVCHCSGMDKRIDIRRTADRILAEKPDFACLQEIDRCAKRSSSVDQPLELARLTGMNATFAKTIPLQGGEYGIMMLSRETPRDVLQVPLPGAEPRALLLCAFSNCVIGTTHLSVAAESERTASIAIIRRIIGEFARGKPVFLTGDWNATPESPVLEGMRQFMQICSTLRGRTFHGNVVSGTNTLPGFSKDFCIDYIAVDRDHANAFRVEDAHIVNDRMTSDHAPIVATFYPIR